MEDTDKSLKTAYSMIMAGKNEQAANLLQQIIRTNPNLAEAWYLLGSAVPSRQKQIDSFNQVLRIDPQRQDARQQLDRLLGPAQVSPFTIDLANYNPDPDLNAKRTLAIIAQNSTKDIKPAQKPVKKPNIPTLPPPAARTLGISIAVIVVLVSILLAGIWILRNRASQEMAAQVVSLLLPSVGNTPTPEAAATQPAFVPSFHTTACSFNIPLGTRVSCGTVSVPQNRARNSTDLIKLPVVLFQSTKPDAGVIVFLQGGPGQEAINWSLDHFTEFVQPVLQEYDMVFFDPRGTGSSTSAPACPELNPVYIDAYYHPAGQEQAFNEFMTLLSKCHDHLISTGINPGIFNTSESAADVSDIAQALGYKKINLLGISYGTHLALNVMRDHPDLVRSAVLDSVMPMQSNVFTSRASNLEYALNKMFSDCAASPRCNSAYPDLENTFNTLITQFDQKPVSIKTFNSAAGISHEITVDGVEFLSAIAWGLQNSELVTIVPKAIYDIQAGYYTFLTQVLGLPGSDYNNINLVTYFATICTEQVFASTPQQIDSNNSFSPVIKKFALMDLFGSSQHIFDLCKAWGTNSYDPRDSQPVTSAIPALILSGQYDPTTPVTNGKQVAANLPNGYFYVIPGMGRATTVGSPCAHKMMMNFYANPAQAPDATTCAPAGASNAFEFFLPYDGKLSVAMEAIDDPSKMVQGMVPIGWIKDLQSPTYHRNAYLFDPTLVNYWSIAAPKSVALSSITRTFASTGFESTPIKTGTYAANGLTWTIYQTKYNGEPAILALAQISSYRTLGINLVASAPELTAYYDGLFIPILNTFGPRNK